MDRKRTAMVRLLGFSKIPMLGYARPKVLELSEETCRVLVPLGRRTKNHWNSMYLGALAVGADLCAGLPAFEELERRKQANQKMGFVFQTMSAEFLWRPDADVTFTMHAVRALRAEVEAAAQDGERHQFDAEVLAHIPGREEPVARFVMGMSFRLKHHASSGVGS